MTKGKLIEVSKMLLLAQRQSVKFGEMEPAKLFADVKDTLNKVVIKVGGGQMNVVMRSLPARAMTAVGMMTWFVIASRSPDNTALVR